MIFDLFRIWHPHLISLLMTLVWFGSVILIHLCVRRPRLPPYQVGVVRQILAKATASFSRLSKVFLWLLATQSALNLSIAAKAMPDLTILFCDPDFHEALTVFSLALGLAYGFRVYRRINSRRVFSPNPRFGGLAAGYTILTVLSYSALHIAAHGGFA